MRLTEFARQLRPQLAEALEGLASVVTNRARFEPRESTRTFSLASADFLLASLGRQLGHQLARRMPSGTLRLEPARLEVLGERLLSAELDLAIAPPIALDPAIHSEPLLEEPWVTALSADHPLAKKLPGKTRLDLEHFTALEHAVVSPTGRGRSAVDTQLAELGLRRRVRLRFDSFLAAGAALVGSQLVLTAPRGLFRGLERKVRLFAPPLPLAPLELALHVDRSRAAAPEVVWLTAELKKALRLLAS
jgi:DNA-binding transcriptional LysR family regulator